ncbi:MAG: UDP-3-O-(3-hydroxymyristoyl)glucosamine N-acyltransferase [Planctomycetes bacterium]|nr:UDP-3-O-(3-hydroxymyristoyl)glucosamine N-acyltransferase [Planctomycetota bacterium]
MPHRPPRRIEHRPPVLRADAIAAFLEAPLVGDAGREIRGPAALDHAREDQVSFVSDGKYAAAAAQSRAGLLLVQEGLNVEAASAAIVRVPEARIAFQRVLGLFFPSCDRLEPGIHETAAVAEDASVHPTATVGPHCTIESGASIGAGAVLRSHVFVGQGSSVGADGYIYPHVSIRGGVSIGARCLLHSGVVIGSDGFGFVRVGDRHEKVAQIGGVRIGDDVEIGANSCIDRGALGDTVIGSGTKIDNLVHIAHNVQIGRNVLLIAQVGLSGSVTIGDDAVLAGQAAVAGHLHVGRGAQIGGRSGVMENIPEGLRVFGFPARNLRDFIRLQRSIEDLPELARKLQGLEAEVARLRQEQRPIDADAPADRTAD